MYIWMILATFMVMLAAYNLSPRADIAHVQNAPQAEAAITRFLAWHKGAEKYAIAYKGALSESESLGCAVLNDYLPMGYICVDNESSSTIYYLNPATGESPEEGVLGKYFVVSYQHVPDKWLNVATNKILGDFYHALASRVPAGVTCGIMVAENEEFLSNCEETPKKDRDNKLCSNYVVEGATALDKSIPPKAISDLEDECTDSDKAPCIVCVKKI